MTVALMFMTDGRKEYAAKTIASLKAMIEEGGLDFAASVVVDDGCDPAYSAWLDEVFPWTLHVPPERRKRGFGGAIRAGWDQIRRLPVDYVFHLEDDFVFTKFFRQEQLVRILEENPKLVQVALKRQPWNSEEEQAGDLVRLRWDSYVQRHNDRGDEWYEQRMFFTTNPSLYRYDLACGGWPTGEKSEGRFSQKIMAADPEAVFGFLGRKEDPPWVTHIGGVAGVSDRTGVSY